jgi:antitoxin VapB
MAVLIEDPETADMIRQLAARTGETIADVVKGAVAGKLARTPLSEKEIATRLKRLREFVAECDAIPTVDHRSADEILGFNDQGHFD